MLACSIASLARADETESEVELGHFGLWPDLSLGPSSVDLVYVRCNTASGPTGCAVRHRRFSSGAWSAEETVPGSTNVSTNDVNRPRVATDSAGRVHVAWAQRISAPDVDIFYARRETTGVWTAAITASTDGSESLDIETLAGSVFIGSNVLVDGETANRTRVYSRAVDGSGAFTTKLLGDLGKDVNLTKSFDGTRLHVGWWWVARFVGIRLYSFSGAWSAESRVDGFATGDHASSPSIIETVDGKRSVAFATWKRITSTDYAPESVFVDDGMRVKVSEAPLATDVAPTLGTDELGARHVIWRDAASKLRIAQAAGNAWTPERIFATKTSVEHPTMAVGTGVMDLVWRDDAGRLRHNRRLLPRAIADAGADAVAGRDAADAADAAIAGDAATDVAPDGGASTDAAIQAADPDAPGGCGCRTAKATRLPSRSLALAAALVTALVVARERRGPRRQSGAFRRSASAPSRASRSR